MEPYLIAGHLISTTITLVLLLVANKCNGRGPSYGFLGIQLVLGAAVSGLVSIIFLAVFLGYTLRA